MESIKKYPRTPHLEGSRLQPGDEGLELLSFGDLRGHTVVIEEKVDGANSGISFVAGEQRLQCRGHYLTGGPRERQFSLFKRWASHHYMPLLERLGERYLMYGEWCYAKHTVFYDALPHYFLEFDLFDREQEVFLSTKVRHELLKGSPVHSVPVLWSGLAEKAPPLTTLVKPSLYKSTSWRNSLDAAAQEKGLDHLEVRRQTDVEDLAEGLYIKVEHEDVVTERYKFVRQSFKQSIADAGDHWMDRPLLPNRLAEGANIWEVALV